MLHRDTIAPPLTLTASKPEKDTIDDETTDKDAPKLADVEACAMRLLSRRGHAEGELRQKLRKRKFPADLIDQACERMYEYGYLDDEAFASHQSAILMRKGWGPRQITHRLYKRGVDEEIIDQAIVELGDRKAWIDACRDRLRSKYRCEPEELDYEAREKAFRHLKWRGFRASVIRQVLFDS